jgi:hypothetical protein
MNGKRKEKGFTGQFGMGTLVVGMYVSEIFRQQS